MSKDLSPSKLMRWLNLLSKSLYVRWISRFSKDLVALHFRIWSANDHPNKNLFSLVVDSLAKREAIILESGTSAWGTDSTRLWDLYVYLHGGKFTSVDISPRASKRLRAQLSKKSRLVVLDSVTFFDNYVGDSPDFVYLDSLDLNLCDPWPAAWHGMAEFVAIYPKLKRGSMILIDDTPRYLLNGDLADNPAALDFQERTGQSPGKGSLVLANLSSFPNIKVVAHEYALLLKMI